MAACEEFVRVACVEARNNDEAYADEDTPSITAIEDLNEKYKALVEAHCEEKVIGQDGWDA